MLDLNAWREKWSMIEEEEDRIFSNLTIEESVKIYLYLCHTFAPMIHQTKDIFLHERENYLRELQLRMRKLTIWLEKRNEVGTEPT
jgi:hypothetical protein